MRVIRDMLARELEEGRIDLRRAFALVCAEDTIVATVSFEQAVEILR